MRAADAAEADLQRIGRDADLATLSRAPVPSPHGAGTFVARTASGVKYDEQRFVIRGLGGAGPPSGGTFTLTGNPPGGGSPWAAVLPYNATPAQAQAAIRAALGDIHVFCFGTNAIGQGGGVIGRLAVRFGTTGSVDGGPINTPVDQMTADLSGLTPDDRPYEFRMYHFALGEPAYPTTKNTYFRLDAIVTGRPVYAYNLGSFLPPLGTLVIARQAGGGYVFTHG